MSNSSEKLNIRRRCHGGVAMAIAAATALAVPRDVGLFAASSVFVDSLKAVVRS